MMTLMSHHFGLIFPTVASRRLINIFIESQLCYDSSLIDVSNYRTVWITVLGDKEKKPLRAPIIHLFLL